MVSTLCFRVRSPTLPFFLSGNKPKLAADIYFYVELENAGGIYFIVCGHHRSVYHYRQSCKIQPGCGRGGLRDLDGRRDIPCDKRHGQQRQRLVLQV